LYWLRPSKKALQKILQEGKNLTLNLGSGEGYSVRQILTAVKSLVGKEVPVILGPRAPEDPTVLIADPSQAKTVLQWKPTLSSIEMVIESAYRWERVARTKKLTV
jgi:UDP-glucose 4-epimerase